MTGAGRWGDLGRLALAFGLLVLASEVLSSVAGSPVAVDAYAREPLRPAPTAPAAVEVRAGQGPVSYVLEATLDPRTHRIAGTGVVRWQNDSRVPQRELWWHAYLQAFADPGSLFARSSVGGGFRGGSGRPAWRGSLAVSRMFSRELGVDLWPGATHGEDATDVRVPLPREVAPGESLTFEVEFVAELPSIVLRTGHAGSFHMVAQWFPKLARLEPDGRWAHFALHRLSEFYADFGDYDVTLDVPEGFLVGATGVPVGGASTANGRRRQRYRALRVHDFAFAAWDGFEEIRESVGPVEVLSLYPRGERVEADLELTAVARGLEHFAERYGPYPYARLTVVRPPAEAYEAGGMEYPTLITTGASTRGRWLGMREIESLALHELAHQWFQGMLASDESRYPMLDEGLTTYAEIEAAESAWPGRSAFDALGLSVSLEHVFGLVARHSEGALDRPASEFRSGRDYVAGVYARTAAMLLTLARVHGEEGMRRALRRYARDQRFRHPTPSDLEAAVRAELGDEAASALRGIVAGGTVGVSIAGFESRQTSATDGAASSRAETGWSGTVRLRRSGDVALPVVVEVREVSGVVTRLMWDGKDAVADLGWSGASAIESVQLDPDGALLLDADGSDNLAGLPHFPLRTWSVAAFVAELVGTLVLP